MKWPILKKSLPVSKVAFIKSKASRYKNTRYLIWESTRIFGIIGQAPRKYATSYRVGRNLQRALLSTNMNMKFVTRYSPEWAWEDKTRRRQAQLRHYPSVVQCWTSVLTKIQLLFQGHAQCTHWDLDIFGDWTVISREPLHWVHTKWKQNSAWSLEKYLPSARSEEGRLYFSGTNVDKQYVLIDKMNVLQVP